MVTTVEVYRTKKVQINKKHVLFEWCTTITSLANNLSNAVRFRQRQVISAANKTPDLLTQNEKEILDEFDSAGIHFSEKKKYPFRSDIEKAMRHSKNPDFFAKGMPMQTAQHVVIKACEDMESFFKAMAEYSVAPDKFTGRPEFPGYKRKGGMCTAEITNQDCTIKKHKDGKMYAGLPFIKDKPLCIGYIDGKLKHVTVTPANGVFVIGFVFQKDIDITEQTGDSCRIVGIDFGVNNMMAVTNNCGLPCLLYKGNIVKSINQFYNKKIASIMSLEMQKPDCPVNKNGIPRFVPTQESMSATLHRNNQVQDFMLKTVCHLIQWCVENRIDTIVAGVNTGWKTESAMTKTNNQNFIQIPFLYIRNILRYKCEEHGIKYIEHEESYTSKASFLDNDPIPVYGKESGDIKFSGRRGPLHYKGMYKKDGFRGLYSSANGTIINSDLNGSANIVRKAIPTAFENGVKPDFNSVVIIKDPDMEFKLLNSRNQILSQHSVMSESKVRRLKKKITATA